MQPGWAKKSVGFSSKVLAYMAASRPVVASVDLDSEMAQLLKDARCGLVVPAGDDQALASGISTLFESADLRATLGANGRKCAEQNFSRPVITNKHLCLFETVCMHGKHKK
jgi:colanic acid biosynthesis glycosyl transferase WcaI